MTLRTRPSNLVSLNKILASAEQSGYAVGSFSPRYTPMIQPVLAAGQKANSPLIVQIAERELSRYGLTPAEFSNEFYSQLHAHKITVPVVLHLDHTKDIGVIHEAIAADFTSVMIDASDQPLDLNIEISREVALFAHARGASVEAELGRIGSTDSIETTENVEGFTDPEEAARFARESGVDALAVSVGTAHGVYTVRPPHIDYARLQRIRALTPVHLVLHGGSGVPSEMMHHAARLPGGGISKVNIATDLELALLGALGRKERMTNRECLSLSADDLALGRAAVEAQVEDKIRNFLLSAGRGPIPSGS